MLLKLVQKFLGHNKCVRTERNSKSMSLTNQKKDNIKQVVSVWFDGITYGESLYEDHIIMHKTFLSFNDLHKDQLQAVFPTYWDLVKYMRQLYPNEFSETDTLFQYINKKYKENKRSVNFLYSIENNAFNINEVNSLENKLASFYKFEDKINVYIANSRDVVVSIDYYFWHQLNDDFEKEE